jgi:pyochelin biosynthesis protein PchC
MALQVYDKEGPRTHMAAWIRQFHPAPEAVSRLVCFPHAGGSATYFFPFSRDLASGTDVVAVQYPGRQDRWREPCVEDLQVLADLVTAELPPWLDRPVAFFGHSMGALLAFEVARRLQEQGVELMSLFVSGRRAPACLRDERLHLAADERLIADLKRLNGTDGKVLENDDVLRMVLPCLRSDYKAVETYRYQPGPRLSCPVAVLTGEDDPQVTPEEARSWENHTSAGFDLRTFPGGHFYLSTQVTAVTETISVRLAALAVGN